MFVFVDSIVYCFILFLSLSRLESLCFSATFPEILLPSSGKVWECVCGIHPQFPNAENLTKTELRYARYTNHLRYSLRCLHNNLIPNDLCLKPKLQDPKSRKILDKASRHLLQNRIHENHYIRKNLQSSIKQATDNLSNTLTQNISHKCKKCTPKHTNTSLKKQKNDS